MNSLNREPFLESLRSIIGAQNVLIDDIESYETDWRQRTRGKALAVIRPKSTQEVVAVVKECANNSVAIVSQGGNTGLVEGAIPDSSGNQIILQLGRMNSIRGVDLENLTVTVDAGCVLQVIQERMRQAGFLFPLSLGAEGSCTIGGNLATNAGGTQVLRYGNARELCLGLEVVTPQGEVWNGLSGLRKDNTGLDLRNLYIGSEGILGVITGATLKLFPLPAAVLTTWVSVSSIKDAVSLLMRARGGMGSSLTGFELMDRRGLELVNQYLPQLRVPLFEQGSPYSLLIECSDEESEEHARSAFERLLEVAMEDGLVTDAVIAESIAQANQMWEVREHIIVAQAENGPNLKHDISMPISKVSSFVESATNALHAKFPGSEVINFGHLGDGNLHFNLGAPKGVDPREFMSKSHDEVAHIVYQEVTKLGGSFSAEHGIGGLKQEDLSEYKCPTALNLMHAIKTALDPNNLMNPGKVLPFKP